MCSRCGHEHGFYGCLVASCLCRDKENTMKRYGMLCKDCKQELPEDSTKIHVCAKETKKMTNIAKKTRKNSKRDTSNKETTEMQKFSGQCADCGKEIKTEYERCYACKFYGSKSYSLKRSKGESVSTRVTKEMKRRDTFDKETRKLECKGS